MGKPSLTDEERRVRDLTRELHEAIQEARQMARELRALDAEFHRKVADAGTSLAAAVDELATGRLAEWEETAARGIREVIDLLHKAKQEMEETEARIAGYKDVRDMAEGVGQKIARTVTAYMASSKFSQVVAQQVIAELNAETGGLFQSRAPEHFATLTAMADQMNQS